MVQAERFDAPHAPDWDSVATANLDLVERMVEGGGYVLYDRDGDVLFFDIGGERKEALTEPFLENIYVRIDPDTLKIEGFTVVGFQHNFLPHNRLFRLALEAYMPDILAGKALHFEGEPARLVAHMFLAAASHTAR